MKVALWWLAVCGVLWGLVSALRAVPDDYKGVIIAVLFVVANVRLIWGLERR